MPEISVCMPVYNTKKAYFREAINSILTQTFSNFEFIIVDDASDKYIEDIVLSYSDKRIKYYKLKTNKGAANARNIAIEKSKGKYIAFMDSDDISLPNRLQKQYDFLENNQNIDCLGTKTEIIGDDCAKMHFPTPTKHEDIELHLIFEGCVFCQSSVMIRKAIVDNNCLKYQTRFVPAEDYAFWLDMLGKAKFEVMEDVLVQYRFYTQNISHRQKDIQAQKCCEAQFETIETYCELTNPEEKLLSSFFCAKTLDNEKLLELYLLLRKLIFSLEMKGFPKESIIQLLKKKYKKLYYHTHTLSGQWHLFKSSTNQLFKIPLLWRIFCFVTRGIL